MITKNAAVTDIDKLEEPKIRPGSLDEFIGHNQLKRNLNIFIDAAIAKKACLDHVLFHGPPGLGKTSLAKIIAKEMGTNFISTSGPILLKSGDLAAILTNLAKGDVLFIDEIHRLSRSVEEILYSAMEDFAIDLIIGEGPGARTVKIELPPFTLVGATTRIGLLTNPLRDRFGIPLRLDFYDPESLARILERAAGILQFNIEKDAAFEIAARSRGTPRIALRLLRRVSDFMFHYKADIITKELVMEALLELGIDLAGLDSGDKRYLDFIIKFYNGGPVGIDTISAGLSEQKDTIEDTIEPYLLQNGFIQRTARGRVVTNKCYDHFGMKAPIDIYSS
jgi:Holliday junction DNA helicase RuvB